MYRILLFVSVLCLMACSGEQASMDSNTTPAAETPTTPASPAAAPGTQYPSVTQEFMNKLGEGCDQVDYTFLELPISLSANEGAAKGSVKSFLRHISVTPAVVRDDCPKIAKIYYQIKGEIVAEADFYYAGPDACKYFVFYEDEKPKYANYLTPEAVAYYNQIFNSLKAGGN